MKRSIFTLVTLASLLFSYSSYSKEYRGTGEWKKDSGDSGSYTVQATIEESNELVSIDQIWNFGEGGEVLSLKNTIQKIDDYFFNILDKKNEVVGNGYCWPLGEKDKICHSEGVQNEALLESTIKLTESKIYRFGSKFDWETGEKLIWKDTLEPVQQTEEN
jgi:hypothetical protein